MLIALLLTVLGLGVVFMLWALHGNQNNDHDAWRED